MTKKNNKKKQNKFSKKQKIIFGICAGIVGLAAIGVGVYNYLRIGIRNQFIVNMMTLDKKEQLDYTVKFPELEFSKASDSSNYDISSLIGSLASGITISGSYTQNQEKDGLFELDGQVNLMLMQVPIEYVGDSSHSYLSLNYLSSFQSIISAFSSSSSTVDLSGKFIDIDDLVTQNDDEENDSDSSEVQQFSSELIKKYIAYFYTMDRKQFVKNGDDITLTFNHQNFVDVIDIYIKLKNSDKYKTIFNSGDSSSTDAKSIMNKFDALTLTMKVNKKTKQREINLVAEFLPEKAGSISKLQVNLSIDKANYKDDPKLPDASDILTEEEVKQIFGNDTSTTNDLLPFVNSDEI